MYWLQITLVADMTLNFPPLILLLSGGKTSFRYTILFNYFTYFVLGNYLPSVYLDLRFLVLLDTNNIVLFMVDALIFWLTYCGKTNLLF